MIFHLLVLVFNFVLGDYNMTLQELLSSSVNLDHLTLVRTFRRQNEECQHVTEEVLVFQYKMKDKEGKHINETVVVTKEEEAEVAIFQSGKNPEERGKKLLKAISFIKHDLDLINIFPRWNCYSQDDLKLIDSIKKHSLIPPSTAPYNLIGEPTHGDGQPRLLDQRYFMEKKKGGFFIEAGAWNGESKSTTLHFELEHGWSGLLVEPIPGKFSELLTKQRRSWAVNTCLSTQTSPETVRFSLTNTSDSTMAGIMPDNATHQDGVKMQCLPLYSLLLSLGNPTVDFLSLDVEGAEYKVLKSLPWSKVDIRAISVETQFAGEVMEGDREDIIKLLTGEGYTHLDTIARDDIFVKLDHGQKTWKPRGEDILQRQSTRQCNYFKVPPNRLSTFCRSMYPLDYFQPQNVEDLPECVRSTTCPYDFLTLLRTYQFLPSWVILLSDGCMAIVS